MGLSMLSSCGTFSGMQTGRTVEKNAVELGLSYYRPKGIFNALALKLDKENHIPRLGYLQFNAKYGITDHLDAGLNLSTYGLIGLEAKYQLLGDQESLFALSAGGSLNTFLFYYYEFQIPVYASVHPLPDLAIYVSPKYAGQFLSLLGLSSVTYNGYTGLSGGIMYGDRVKVGLDGTFMHPTRRVLGHTVFPDFYNIGIGVKWTINGGKEKDEWRGTRF
jgi:hypothetical protein